MELVSDSAIDTSSLLSRSSPSLCFVARPKSPRRQFPSESIKIFPGFRSLWISLRLWMYARASMIWRISFHISRSSIFSTSRSSINFRKVVAQYSWKCQERLEQVEQKGRGWRMHCDGPCLLRFPTGMNGLSASYGEGDFMDQPTLAFYDSQGFESYDLFS